MPEDDAKRRAALFSAYYHATNRGGAGSFMVSESLRPDPLDVAVRVLREGTVERRRYQRLALGKLLGAGLHQPWRWGSHEAVVALAHSVGIVELEDFDAQVVTNLIARLVKKNKHLSGDRELLTQPALMVGSAAFEAAAQDIVYAQGPITPDCDCKFAHLGTVITYDTSALVTTVEVSFLVRPSNFYSLACALDPRNWRVIGPDFFPQTYKVLEVDGNPVFDGDTPKPDAEFEHEHPHGGFDWAGSFYEVYRWNWNEASLSEFRNLLRVTYAKNNSARTVTMSYVQSRCIESKLGFDRIAGGVDVDDGCTIACPWDGKNNRPFRLSGPNEDPPWWKVRCSKRLRFTDRTDTSIGVERPFDFGTILNYLTPALVTMFLEIASKEGACVKIPPDVDAAAQARSRLGGEDEIDPIA